MYLKKCISLLLIYAFINLFEAQAQDQKIGFIDSDEIIQNMPEYSGIEQRLSLLTENWREEIRQREDEIEDLELEFEAREILFTEEIRTQRINEIEQKRNELDQFIEEKFGPRGEYFERQKELLEPIQRQIFDALEQIANRDNFDFVFDRSEDARLIFTRDEWNLTEEVMLELGIEFEEN